MTGIPDLYKHHKDFRHNLRFVIGVDSTWKLLDNWRVLYHLENNAAVKQDMEKWNIKIDEVPIAIEGIQLNPGAIELGKSTIGPRSKI